jgi:DNA repair exonuclease SbcCD ATPase subunit/predicted phosphodiesterase
VPKFAHIADTHIKNLKYHYEYRIVFDQLYEKLREERVDYIIHCGDIAHTKTQISPEFVELCTDFFRNLGDIAPTHIILGNHDGNLRNSSRQDALTPIADALQHPNIYLHKNSGEVKLDDNYCLNVLSVFDEENWISPSDPDTINIALYHGSISGVKTDTGWVMENGEHDISIFNNHDFGFLGDIHKTNQTLDPKGRIRYPGSTIQQNHGETNDKGILIWNIRDRWDWDVKHVAFKNPKPFITIELTPKGRIPKKTAIPTGARLRLVSNNNLPLDVMKKAVNTAKYRFKPESIAFLNRAAGERGNVEELTVNLFQEDLRDLVIQQEFIEEYLKDYEVEDGLLERVIRLNEKYNKIAEENEEISRNINWKLKSFEWDNLFNYGEGNKIDFSRLNGIVGIFGKNYSGKSSIIDAILYTMFNSTSKKERKNLNVINQNHESGTGKVEIEVGAKTYIIERSSEKYIKRLKGEETLEAKTDLEFYSVDKVMEQNVSQNGLTRNDTDKNIRKNFGTLDDFLLTAMSSQLDSLSFVKEGSTKRKEILAKFLDLEIFDQKFKLAKEDSTDLKGALRRLEGKEYDEYIAEAESALSDNQAALAEQKKNYNELQSKISSLVSDCAAIRDSIESIPAEIVDIIKVRAEVRSKKNQIISLSSQNSDYKVDRKDKETLYQKISEFLEVFDIDGVNEKKEKIDNLIASISQLENDLILKQEEYNRNKKKCRLLDGIPCGSSFPSCKFIKDAHVATAMLPVNEGEIEDYEEKKTIFHESLTHLNPEKVNEHLLKHQQLLSKKAEVTSNIADLNLKIERNLSVIERTKNDLEKLQVKIDEYEQNKEAIENLEELNKRHKIILKAIELHTKNSKKHEKKIMDLYKDNGSLEQKLEHFMEQKEELNNLREEYSAYDLYMRCMHSNGIAYDIIKKKLPVINEEVAKVLANIVEFEVFFDDDGKRLNIFIKHPNHDARPLEMGSGAEKTIAAMAIRLALLSVSNLPKGDVFILDEPGTALDPENLQGFVSILDIIKSYFNTVLLISHMDALKDIVDMTIDIEKKDGYAFVNQ